MISIVCAQCGREFAIYPCNAGVRVYCSRKCLGASRANTAAKFWQRVARAQSDECWEWQGKRDKNGYGALTWSGRYTRAHRVALTLTDGDWGSPLNVCHTCDNPPCCNPKHLWRGTNLDNMTDKMAKGRQARVGARGERAGSAKLSAEQVIAIRASALSGSTLARQYGVARNYIFAIKKHLTWKHLP